MRHNESFAVSVHVEGICPTISGRVWDILKKASLTLCFGYLESGKFIKYRNIAAQDAHGMYIKLRIASYVYAYIRRGLRCCCLVQKAIPEPQIAEQQYCSPAFLCLYIIIEILITNKKNRPNMQKVG